MIPAGGGANQPGSPQNSGGKPPNKNPQPNKNPSTPPDKPSSGPGGITFPSGSAAGQGGSPAGQGGFPAGQAGPPGQGGFPAGQADLPRAAGINRSLGYKVLSQRAVTSRSRSTTAARNTTSGPLFTSPARSSPGCPAAVHRVQANRRIPVDRSRICHPARSRLSTIRRVRPLARRDRPLVSSHHLVPSLYSGPETHRKGSRNPASFLDAG